MRSVIAIVAGLLGGVAASAQEAAPVLRGPHVSVVPADWTQAGRDAARLVAGQAADSAGEDALPLLNEAMAVRFPAAAASAVPVLLPFDAASYLRDRAQGETKPTAQYMPGLRETGFFLAGPAGYAAAFAVDGPGLPGNGGARFSYPVLVEISASALIYRLPQPSGVSELPPGAPAKDIPGLRRFILEHYLRYSFERYGTTYVVSISCIDGRPRARWISCRQAEPIAQHVLATLQLAGGAPAAQPQVADASGAPVERPQAVSSDFTYHPAGAILPGTGFRKHAGVADATVYAAIRFPFDRAPAFANSQSFMHWGDCDQTGRTPHPRGRKGANYRCRVNDKPLVFDESATENYSYPWRDNFCEHRHFSVGQCPGGRGHQGQDIRPAECRLRNEGADRCEPYQHDIVAVRSGQILRSAGTESVYLTANDADAHVRFRYMHMHPKHLDSDGVISGRTVREGEIIGKAGNFNRRENLTTYHLHFEMMVPTREGWVRVNPYMTLVAAYERLIGARGREIEPDAENVAAASGEPPADAAENGNGAPSEGGDEPEAERSPAAAERGADADRPPASALNAAPQKPANAKAVESSETKPSAKSSEAKSSDAKSSDAESSDAKSSGAKPSVKPAKSKKYRSKKKKRR